MERGGEESLGAGTDRDRISLNVLFGLPNDQKARIIVEGDGKPLNYDLLGSVGLLPHLPAERFRTHVIYLWHGRRQPVKLGPGALLNHSADADLCSVALDMARRIQESSGRPCFNPPAAVAKTSRDEVARRLAGISGLIVPGTIRVREREPDEIRDAVARAGLGYPILVRVAGSHLGMTLICIDRPDELDAVSRLNRDDRSSLYVTEFRDFASPDGRYRKFRVVVIGDEIFLRHCIISENWLIHRGDRAENTEDEERATFEAFDREWRGHLEPVFKEIGSRLGLDYFGVDCHIDNSGNVLLFEANACMNVMANTRPPPNMWEQHIARIKEALERRLASPRTWRSFSPRENSVA